MRETTLAGDTAFSAWSRFRHRRLERFRAAQKRSKRRCLKRDHALKAVSPANVVSLIQHEINFGIEAVRCLRKGKVDEEIILRRGKIRLILIRLSYLPQLLQYLERNWIHPADRNLIVCKLCSRLSRRTITRSGIVDLASAVCFQRGTEIDEALRIRGIELWWRDGERIRNLLVIRCAQVVTEEEQLVFPDGAADAPAKVVIGKMPQGTAKVRAGIDGVVLDEFERRTMECIGPGLENDVGDGAGGASQFSFKVVGRDIYGLDRLCWRDDDL